MRIAQDVVKRRAWRAVRYAHFFAPTLLLSPCAMRIMHGVDSINDTAPAACASPEGAPPPTLTSVAGAQTVVAVSWRDVRVTCENWPRDGSTLSTATVEGGRRDLAGVIWPVVIGLDPDAVGCGTRTGAAVYVADGNDWPDEIDAAVQHAIATAWEESL